MYRKTEKGMICWGCKEEGHKRIDCHRDSICGCCKGKGHTRAACPYRKVYNEQPPKNSQRQKGSSIRGGPMVCWNCRELGHYRANCPYFQGRPPAGSY